MISAPRLVGEETQTCGMYFQRGFTDARLDEQEESDIAKRNNGPATTGPFRLNMRFNLAIRLPLQWIAALFYLLR